MKWSSFIKLPVWVLPFALTVLLLELLSISQSFDAYSLHWAQGLTPWQNAFAYFGQVAKIGVLFVVLACLLLWRRLPAYLGRLQDAYSSKRFLLSLFAQLLLFAAFYAVTAKVFKRDGGASDLWYLLWLLLGLGLAVLWFAMLGGWNFYRDFLRREALGLLASLLLAVAVWGFALLAQSSWSVLSDWTFRLSAWLLSMFSGDTLVVDPTSRNLGLGDFVVNIAAACSGYEGMGLITAFLGIYLVFNRKDFRFPQVLILFPLGIAAMFLLNSLRIVLLIMVGRYWSADIAVGGFHSQAGWLTFIATSLLLLFLSSRMPQLRKDLPSRDRVPMNLAMATLIPFIALLAVTLLTSAFSGGFDWLYPFRVLVVIVALYVVWPQIKPWPFRLRWESVFAGVFVALLWLFFHYQDPDYNHNFSQHLLSVSPFWAGMWLLFRVLGAVLTVPMAEELAFRSYVLCRLARVEVSTRGAIPFSLLPLAISSLAFGFMHGAWVAGSLAGLAYGSLRLRTGSVYDCVAAHALTNLLIFIYAACTSQWILL